MKGMILSIFFLLSGFGNVAASEPSTTESEPPQILNEDQGFWYAQGKEDLLRALNRQLNLNTAKNVIFFLGDGMGVSTVTAARIHAGQKLGELGEENYLSFEKFPNLGLLKTYNVDRQVADSAGSATSYLTGVKGRYGTLGLDVSAPFNVCRSDLGTKPNVDSVLKWAQDAGKATGFVTTTRVTHATPAGLYAHTANRDWECDSQVPLANRHECKDIARQLIEDEPGRNIKIILGGGRQVFEAANDNGTTNWPCKRGDNMDLIEAWKVDKKNRDKSYLFLENRDGLLNTNLDDADFILGLFSINHIPYELDRVEDPKVGALAPGIEEMTEKAIRFLQKKSTNGFFLLVEGGRIDHAHHKNNALLALEETVAMHKAVAIAQRLTDNKDTLIVVTADHSHTFNINGYPVRGNKITGVGGVGDNGYNYTTLSYSSGPGFWKNVNNGTTDPHKPWLDASTLDVHNKTYRQLSQIPAYDAYHGGEDVAVYATGPMSHLFHGVHEQSYVAHVVGHAACMGPYASVCDVPKPEPQSAGVSTISSHFTILLMAFAVSTTMFGQ